MWKRTERARGPRIRKKLGASEIDARMANLDGWRTQGAAIAKEFEFHSFAVAMQFVNAVAAAAEAINHHPDIDIRYRKVKLELATHSAGGLTALDFDLARAADATARGLIASGPDA